MARAGNTRRHHQFIAVASLISATRFYDAMIRATLFAAQCRLRRHCCYYYASAFCHFAHNATACYYAAVFHYRYSPLPFCFHTPCRH